MLTQHAYIPQMLSKSRLSRRLHHLKVSVMLLFNLLGHVWKILHYDNVLVIDSLPVAVRDNSCIQHAKLYTEECFRSYIASKKRYFYGLTIHLMVTKDG